MKNKRASPASAKKMPRTTVSLPREVMGDLERMAARKKVSVSWVIRDAVEKYLKSEEPLFHRT